MPAVLFIDDDTQYHVALRRALKQWDFLFATSGDQGLTLALQHLERLDIIIFDMHLTRVTGQEVYTEIRRHHDTIPIIVASTDTETVAQLASHPWTWVVRKPIAPRALVTLIHEAVTAYTAIRPALPAVLTTSFEHQVVDTSDPDAQPIPHLLNALDALDLSLVQQHLQTASARSRVADATDPVMYLHKQRCVIDSNGVFVPTRAGVLAFSSTPEQWMSNSGIDIVQFSGDTPSPQTILFQSQVRGSLFEQIDRTFDLLWARTDHKYIIDGTERMEYHAYAPQVLRELTTNAVVHRDWDIKGRTRIQLFPDRIEWISPGRLPEGANINALREAQVQRNPWLAQLLYDAGRVEAFGMGFDTVEDILQAWGCPPPQVRETPYAVTIGVAAKPLPQSTPDPVQPSGNRKSQILTVIAERGSITRKALQALFPTITERTLQRDLRDLVLKGEILEEGSTNDRRYTLVPPPRR